MVSSKGPLKPVHRPNPGLGRSLYRSAPASGAPGAVLAVGGLQADAAPELLSPAGLRLEGACLGWSSWGRWAAGGGGQVGEVGGGGGGEVGSGGSGGGGGKFRG